MFSFDEVVEPIFNRPMTLAAQELSSKVANLWFDYRSSDQAVKDLIAKASDPKVDTNVRYMSPYALGFANNPLAVDTLKNLMTDPDDYVRLAAISSLGILHTQAMLPSLVAVYEKQDSLWQEKAMALKAIGDLGITESKAYLEKVAKDLGSQGENQDNRRLLKIVGIYLMN